MKCQCDGPGYCDHLKRNMNARQHAICSGQFPNDQKPLPDQKCQAYREKWLREAGKTTEGQPRLDLPPLRKRVVNFVNAAGRHLRNRLRSRKIEEIEQILEICSGCERLENNHCAECGCPINDQTFLSKLAWKSESCPLKPPKWGPGTENP